MNYSVNTCFPSSVGSDFNLCFLWGEEQLTLLFMCCHVLLRISVHASVERNLTKSLESGCEILRFALVQDLCQRSRALKVIRESLD